MNYKNKIFFITSVSIILLIFAFIFIKTTNKEKLTYNMASVHHFKNLTKEDVILIDVRTSSEFSQGHIEGAINMDFLNSNFEKEILKLEKNKEYAIYCRSGNRSKQAFDLFIKNGFDRVTDLEGGILAWEAEGNIICNNC